MKKFTVKDFIMYNGPCFNCRAKATIKIGSVTADEFGSTEQPALLTPTITNESTEVDLKINYNSGLKLTITNKTNKFQASSMRLLTEYLRDHKLFLKTNCDSCYTNMESQYLELNLLKGFIKPVGISRELLIVNDGVNLYQVHTSFLEDKSLVIVDRVNKAMPITPVRMNLPPMPRYRFRDKEHFSDKMKTYL